MITYIPIDACLDSAYFPKPLRKECDDSDILSYFLDAYRMLNLPLQYERKIVVLPINTHNVELPTDVHSINLVTFLNYKPCETETVEKTQETITRDYNIFYKIFETNLLNSTTFLPMRNVGNSSSILCNCCNNPTLNSCNEVFSVTPAKTLMTSIKDGFVCLDYNGEITDEEGRFLIVNTVEIKRYLGLYAQAMHFMSRASTKEEQAFSMAERLLSMTEIAMRKARGHQNMGSIDLHTINAISGTETYNQKLLRIPQLFYKKYNN